MMPQATEHLTKQEEREANWFAQLGDRTNWSWKHFGTGQKLCICYSYQMFESKSGICYIAIPLLPFLAAFTINANQNQEEGNEPGSVKPDLPPLGGGEAKSSFLPLSPQPRSPTTE